MPHENKFRMCAVSVMDNLSDPDISFDENGVSNYYYEYQKKAKQRIFNSSANGNRLERLVNKIKTAGGNREYDCLIGISGGVDSTFIAYKVKEMGLRPLAVHFDNGWNSELAVKNIESALKQLNIDLYTYVIDWEEFKSLQIAFLKASTPDGEIPTDHAIFALLFQVANENNIKYILNGNNFATESVLPPTWAYGHIDWYYIKELNKRFGKKQLRAYPKMTLTKYFYYSMIKKIKIISLLNYLEYNKDEAMEILKTKLGWKYYGGKHYESVYTRFYQGYILPQKFKIDKRKAHLSSLIFSGQMSRQQALEELKKPIYPEGLLEEDKLFVLKKFNLTESEFQELITLPNKTYRDYPNKSKVLGLLRRILNKLREKKVVYS